MIATRRSIRTATRVIAAFSLSLFAANVFAAMPPLTADGWHTWRVDAVNDAPSWCCSVWRNKVAEPKICDLDGDHHHFLSSRVDARNTAEMQIYVRVTAGEVNKITTLSTTCSVRSSSPVTDHGRVASRDSVDWLGGQIDPRTRLSADALAAIAVHEGTQARRTLVATARDNANLESRKDAIFWMGQTRARETSADIRRLMFDDPLADIRQHAAFSWSQSGIANRGDALRRLGTVDRDESVRAQAWFWLAQSGEPDSETAILTALDLEKSRKVRNELIFALTQLPDERSTDALITLIENRRLPVDDRKKALFWMAQSESGRALDYLAKLLDD